MGRGLLDVLPVLGVPEHRRRLPFGAFRQEGHPQVAGNVVDDGGQAGSCLRGGADPDLGEDKAVQEHVAAHRQGAAAQGHPPEGPAVVKGAAADLPQGFRQGDFLQEVPRHRVKALFFRGRAGGACLARAVPAAPQHRAGHAVPHRPRKAVAAQPGQGQHLPFGARQGLGQGQDRLIPVGPGQGGGAVGLHRIVKGKLHGCLPSKTKRPRGVLPPGSAQIPFDQPWAAWARQSSMPARTAWLV